MPPRSPKPKKASAAADSNPQRQLAQAQRVAAPQTTSVLPDGPATVAEKQRLDVLEQQQERLDSGRKAGFERRWRWTAAFWVWMLAAHALALYLFTSGFLLTRLVLPDKSACDAPPIEVAAFGDVEKGCWHPKTFKKTVVVIIDALRYDFTVPLDQQGEEKNRDGPQYFHDALPFLYESAVKTPQNAFLRPFIADPPTTTLQRLKGLTTGTLPTFIDAGSNFAGTAIDEDNLLVQFRDAGKRIAHLGDDTWWSLFPDYFEPNISKAYDSFNVWDLHTVDYGVINNIFPLLEANAAGDGGWDVLIGHCLGVDHAGHRYGPHHPAMTSKLQQMDEFVRNLAGSIDDDTLLVVMGDHGMDGKGDHGGESDDEVEAALWMYSKKPVFGRTQPDFATPPPTAKIRPVNQIDLVPTLALLLGVPIPFNNLGRPIEEAFAGSKGNDWKNLAAVSRIAAAGVERYQASYFSARGIAPASGDGSPAALWQAAVALGASGKKESYDAFTAFLDETLSVCKFLWARFDVPRMIMGVVLAAAGVIALVMYSSRDEDDDYVVTNDIELDYAEKRLELLSFNKDGGKQELAPPQDYHKRLVRGVWDKTVLFVLVLSAAASFYRGQAPLEALQSTATTTGLIMVAVSLCYMLTGLHAAGKTLLNIFPNTIWGWMSAVFTISQSIGFASNSYTVWEDTILLFFITTFGAVSVIAAFRVESKVDRTLAIYHAVAFTVLARFASFSKLCREEQMPFCTSTYYASAASSTSAPWQLLIPAAAAVALPAIVKSFVVPTRSWEGLTPVWIGWVFRGGLGIAAVYWAVDAADNGDWFAGRVSSDVVKSAGIYVAQLGLALAFVAGWTAFVWAPPSVNVVSTATNPAARNNRQPQAQARVTILGYGNALGARYLILPLNVIMGLAYLTKPMGAGSLALMLWQVLSLAEVVDLLNLKAEAVGPVVLAMLGNFYYFRTGHQATLASIQWDSAFVALRTIRYPWSPLAVALNTFGPQILAAVSVPLVTCMWKVGPKQKGVLAAASRGLGLFVAYYAVEALATMAWAGHLRRHLMLYRVFCPRYMMAGGLLLVVDVLGIGMALAGVRSNTLAVGEVFGFPE